LVSLAGGWFLAGRALRPIRRITQAAQAISASNLSQRIDVARMEDELGALARTLNDAFDRLERAFEQQARFTADASHELRTPLSVLISQAQLALARDRDAPQYRAALETCLAAGRRMRATVEGLLKLARADAGKADIARGSVALASVVREAVALLRPAAAEHRVELSADLGAGNEDGVVIGDASLLAEMVGNLVGNAVRYNRPGGRVDVRLASSAGRAILTVADTGVGIPAADLPHVFERFYRVDRSRARESEAAAEGGSGLGLAIAKWIVDAHRGEISVASDEGKGTVVTVTLPRE